ncbi:carbohydrate ABC transporter permease [Nonomuraea rhodomycinica]|uniref:Carbohydrate ABC transporter permease n=1 Tax=Nonomuraea rhodomycinica TaxID=1712872 RepID=A0A7Y6MGY0_9ACTN|nr:carbohydrate ABC transporter permease [Nonomuraea rhodomycinica]NUW46126.1 carbohydrate ABC transporter permease [Nonomuraea rhodomycinica]
MISTREKVFNDAFLTLLALSVLVPVGWILGVAVSPSTSGTLDLAHPQWSNFATAWQQAGFGHYLRSSVVITGTVVTVSTVLAAMSGYAFGVLGVLGEKAIFPLMLLGIVIPMESIIVPLYYDFLSFDLTDGYQGIILAHVGMGVSFGAFWMRAAFRTVPASIAESAELDGAGSWARPWRIYLPISRPAVVQINLLAAAAVLMSLPIVVLYLFFQRQFIRGMLSGALKG